jgi:hypothetical protein
MELQSATTSYPKAPRGVTPGARSGPKHRKLARQVGGVSLIQASSMAITFQHKIALRPGSVFYFGTISFVADEEGILHRIADPSEKKPSSKISEKAGTRQQIAQPPAPRAKTTSCKPGAENSFTRRTLLSTSSTEEWTRIMRKKEANGIEARQAALLAPSPSKEDRKKLVTTTTHRLPSLTTSQPCLGKNPLSEKLVDGGTNAGMFGDIMNLENKTWRSLYLEMRSQRWETLLTNESSGKG